MVIDFYKSLVELRNNILCENITGNLSIPIASPVLCGSELERFYLVRRLELNCLSLPKNDIYQRVLNLPLCLGSFHRGSLVTYL